MTEVTVIGQYRGFDEKDTLKVYAYPKNSYKEGQMVYLNVEDKSIVEALEDMKLGLILKVKGKIKNGELLATKVVVLLGEDD